MSEIDGQQSEYRRRRVQRLKKAIVKIAAFLILAPNICCVFLCVRMSDLYKQMDGLYERIDGLSGRLESLSGQIEELAAQGEDHRIPEQESGDVSVQPEIKAEPEEGVTGVIDVEPQASHRVYLTFDDGPSIYTNEILDILKEYDVKATFFVVGKEDADSQEALQRIVEEGHTLGMHSFSHKYGELYQSVDSFREDFHKLQDYLYDLTGVKSVYYRFPGGSSNKVSPLNMQTFVDYLDTQEVEFYDWNVSSGDGGSRILDVDTLLHNCTDTLGTWRTAIVLMHDAAEKRTTVDALPEILENILAREDTAVLPITEDTEPVHHLQNKTDE